MVLWYICTWSVFWASIDKISRGAAEWLISSLVCQFDSLHHFSRRLHTFMRSALIFPSRACFCCYFIGFFLDFENLHLEELISFTKTKYFSWPSKHFSRLRLPILHFLDAKIKQNFIWKSLEQNAKTCLLDEFSEQFREHIFHKENWRESSAMWWKSLKACAMKNFPVVYVFVRNFPWPLSLFAPVCRNLSNSFETSPNI